MIDALSSFISSTSNGINSKNSSNYKGNNSFEALLTGITNHNNVPQKAGSKAGDNSGELLKYIQQVWINLDTSLVNIGSDSKNTKKYGQVNPVDSNIDINNTEAYESMLSNDGPLPRFLHEMDVRLNLNATQRQALRDIAMENKDVIKSPDVVQKIALQLQRAGIYESYTHSA